MIEIQDTQWDALRQHLERDALILVAAGLDLQSAAQAMAHDDKERVAQWIGEGLVSKPTQEQLDYWESDAKRQFRFAIVAPYVLIQVSGH